MNKEMYKSLGISEAVVNFGEKVLCDLEKRFKKIDENAEYNQLKVLKAMQDNKVSEACLLGTTGYGYNDIGREKIESIFCDVFGAEDALVRGQFVSGSHALTVALFSFLRPNDTMLSITGTPYDTLHEVIGLNNNQNSLYLNYF